MSDLLEKAFQFHKNGQYEDAERLYKEILKQDAKNIEVNILLGKLEYAKFNYNSALEYYTIVLNTEPLNKEALFGTALVYKNMGKLEDAKKQYEILVNNYIDFDAYYNLASIYSDLGDIDKAILYYNKVLENNENDRETKYFMSLAYMKNKEYEKGLSYFETRLCRESAIVTQTHTYKNLMNSAKLWCGEDITDKTIYTYYEAGFGDMLMFARYLPLLQKRCKKIILKPQTELYELFQENFPDIEVMKYFIPERQLQFDYHIPFLSLPYVLGLKNDEIFINHKSYLKPDAKKVTNYKDTLFNNDKFKIGIKWQGNTMYDFERVIDVKEFIKLFSIPNIEFYSFQMGKGSERINELNIVDIGKELKNFSDTAAALENMDLIICNDTSLAHLAGAINKPCWILLPYLYNWRWHQNLSKCDWYDSVKLYRQSTPKNWDSVFDNLYIDLSALLSD